MRVTPIKQDIYLAKNKLKTGAKKVERKVEKHIPQKVLEKMPKKLTWNNFPVAAGLVGLLTPIPFASAFMYGVAKVIQILGKKFLHKA